MTGQHDPVAAETGDARMNEGVVGRMLGDPHDEAGPEKVEHGVERRRAYEQSAIDAKDVKFFGGMLPKRVFYVAGRVRGLSRANLKPRPKKFELGCLVRADFDLDTVRCEGKSLR